MSKILLTKVRLINWYGFTDEIIPIGKVFTLIAGENESGKSTILDAIKYGFTGDSEFNKSSSNTNNKRNICSYVRCLTNVDNLQYARPVDQYPNLTSHIALEYYDETYKKYFVLGTIIETNSSNNCQTYGYTIDKKTLDEIDYYYEKDGKRYIYDHSTFQKKYGVKIATKTEAIKDFMQRTGLKFTDKSLHTFQRKLRAIMTYNPKAKIQQFIKESVLEERNVKFNKLKESKKNIDRINDTLKRIDQEISDLEVILFNFSEYQKQDDRLVIDSFIRLMQEVESGEKELLDLEKNLEVNRIIIDEASKDEKDISAKKDNANDELLDAKLRMNEMDGYKAIEDEKRNLNNYSSQDTVLVEAKEKLNKFQQVLYVILEKLMENKIQIENVEILENIEGTTTDKIIKEQTVNELKRCIGDVKDKYVSEKAVLKNEIVNIEADINTSLEIIKKLESNIPDYSRQKENIRLRDEINKELKKRGITDEARMACEYVVNVDNDWQDAIEAFLNVHRFSIIVNPEYFGIASEVLDKSNYKYVELVNTPLLLKKTMEMVDDSVMNKLDIKNEHAVKYFQYFLGRVHAVDKDNVSQYENAISKECKLSRNMAITYLNKKRIGTYVLGQDSVKKNLENEKRNYETLKKIHEEKYIEQQTLKVKIDDFNEYLECFKEYDYDAVKKYEENIKNIEKCREKIAEMEKSLENNSTWIMLNNRVSELEREQKRLSEQHNQIIDRKNKAETENERIKEKADTIRKKLKSCVDDKEKIKLEKPLLVNQAETEKSKYSILTEETRRKYTGVLEKIRSTVLANQHEYNAKKDGNEKLEIGLEYIAEYQKRKDKIWIDDREEVTKKLNEQTKQYEAIFKNEFVLGVYNYVNTALDDIKELNRELRKLKFESKYRFDVKPLDDTSDFAKILRYAEYLKKTNVVDNGQMMFGALYGYEDGEIEKRKQEVEGIINKIVSNDENMINEYADYRNYMSYEVFIKKNDSEKEDKLSKSSGYNSGAGTQIPYTLILSAALSQLYNNRQNSTRLIFIDEPFEKMSQYNVKEMLEFFKSQDFQVIFCAADKLSSIGEECDVLIPVLKVASDDMQVGVVQYH